MLNGINEREARENILREVKEYCEKYHQKPAYKEGDRIPYASRVYDSEEMCNLVKGVSDARVMITYEQGATVSTFGYEKGEERISGVAIACNGGDDPEIKLALYELVDALFNIKSTRITVSPRN